MQLHVVAGLPRSGSTLLCNLLAQRPELQVSSTSALPALLGGISQLLTNSPEVTSDLLNVEGATARPTRILRAAAEAWHDTDGIVIDKSRGWAPNAVILQRVFPEAVMLIPVRDPREVFASVERQHRRSGEYGPHELMYEKASAMLSPEGLIGAPIRWCEDLVRRQLGRVLFINYHALTVSPDTMMTRVDRALSLEKFDYDFENVENQATDADALYRFKYPHDGEGPVRENGSGWTDVIDEGTANAIAGRWPFYMQTFGFT